MLALVDGTAERMIRRHNRAGRERCRALTLCRGLADVESEAGLASVYGIALTPSRLDTTWPRAACLVGAMGCRLRAGEGACQLYLGSSGSGLVGGGPGQGGKLWHPR